MKVGLDDFLIEHSIDELKRLPVKEVKKLGEAVQDVTKDTPFEEIHDLFKRIAGVSSEFERDRYIDLISKKTGISKRSVKKDILRHLSKEDAKREVTENIIIAHPSYEVNNSFISLGFKETVIIDDRPASRNIFLLCTGEGCKLYTQAVIESGGRKIIFDERERILITLPDKWSKAGIHGFINSPVSPEGLYSEIKGTLRQYVEFQNDALYGLVTAWIIATYFHRLFNAFPFLFFYGKKMSGKSRILDLLERLCFNALKIKGVSVPSMTDSIDGIRGTFVMDQAESLSQKQNVELLGILADSYTPGGGKRRIVHITNKSRKVVEFETYSPKAFASIKEIDSDLKDRCIEIIMLRAEKEYPYPEPFLPIWAELRDKLYRLLLTRWQEVRQIYQTAGQGMRQRVRELWRPLDTILTLENVPDEERQGIKQAFLESMLETQAGLTELEEKLIQAIDNLLGYSGEGVFTTTEIVEKMQIADEPTFKKSEQTKWAGRTVNKLGLYSKKLGRSGNKHKYFFTREHIENISNLYKIDGFNGATAEASIDATLQNAIEKTVMAQSADLIAHNAIKAIRQKVNGASENLDNKQSCHCADNAIELMAEDNISEFIPEDEPLEINDPDSLVWEN